MKKKKQNTETSDALKALLASQPLQPKEEVMQEKIIPQQPVVAKQRQGQGKNTALYLKHNDLEQLKNLRLGFQKFSLEGKQPTISEIIRTSIHSLSSTEETYSCLMKLKEQDGRKSLN